MSTSTKVPATGTIVIKKGVRGRKKGKERQLKGGTNRAVKEVFTGVGLRE